MQDSGSTLGSSQIDEVSVVLGTMVSAFFLLVSDEFLELLVVLHQTTCMVGIKRTRRSVTTSVAVLYVASIVLAIAIVDWAS